MLARTNPHEEAARGLKVARLVEEIDRHALLAELDPYRAAGAIAEVLERWDAAHWAQAALGAAVRPPSPTTRQQVIARYRRRAQEGLS